MMAREGVVVAVVGATTLVGEELVRLLGDRQFPAAGLRLLGTSRTAGRQIEDATIALLGPSSFDGVDVAFFAAGPAVAGEFVGTALRAGAHVVDASSRFRLEATVPLVVPEVNAAVLTGDAPPRLVASPSSTAVGLAVVLAPLVEAAGVRRVAVATYQSAAGGGRRAVEHLSRESIALLSGRGDDDDATRVRRAFNCIPEIGTVEPDGATTYELAVVEEVRKVLADPELAMHVTAVRVPMFFGVGASVTVELERPLDRDAARAVLRDGHGLLLHEEEEGGAPTPADVIGSQATHVGRLREDPSVPGGLAMWVTLDSIEKGVALNAVQIAEILIRRAP
jgi:aspartate-semialdehyde dehydrogenase